MDADAIRPIGLPGSVMLLNHGPTVLISTRDDGVDDVMPAAWVSPLRLDPPAVTAAIFPIHTTHHMIRSRQEFVIQIPTAEQVNMVYTLGHVSLGAHADKLRLCGTETFEIPGYDLPFVADCAAWFVCRVSETASMIEDYSLFVADIVGAWANTELVRDRRWHFGSSTGDTAYSTLHHTGGGNFYTLAGATQAAIEIDQRYLA